MKSEAIHKSSMPPEDFFIPEDILDIHELGHITHHEFEYVIERFIIDNYNRKYEKIKIITGKGKVISPLTITILKKSKYVKEYRFAGYFSGQNGAIEIILKRKTVNRG